MKASSPAAFAMLCAAATLAACTVHKTEAPPLSGPSEFGLSLTMTATPDSISQDGGSQSSVRISARGPDGRPIAALPMRVDTAVNGVAQDFGNLSARTIVTGSDGIATVTYTAPRQSQGANSGTCNGLPGTCVTIVATATGSNFEAANPEVVTIRLVPPGVILPPAGSPTAAFTITPTPPLVDVPLTFDASNSTPGQNSSGITSYSWDFGDGSATATGKMPTHTFTTTGLPGTTQPAFNVTLTVTNDRGLSASSTQAVQLALPDPFSGDWEISPTDPHPNQLLIFIATKVQASPGHVVVQYTWDFGDPQDQTPANGVVSSHTYSQEGNFTAVLTVVDDLGRKKVSSKTIPVTKPK